MPRRAGVRWGTVPQKRLARGPVIKVPTITLDGADDPFTLPGNGSSYAGKFAGKYAHRTLKVGHNVPQEAPADFARAVIDVYGVAEPLSK
ncbi:alpha/beta fold hydrolase [Streptomyces sp. NPDC094153]|uniref:alpha/beta fold hydrolase n=1 Tax=Streptomyces sp. NPDC094153 TaxID=3366058 RepID=UPI00380FAB16